MNLRSVLAVGSLLAASGLASATTIVTLNYNDLSGNYTGNASAGTFNAHAVAIAGGLQSAGDVARVVAPSGVADFQPGFFGGSSANFVLNMTLGPIVANTRTGSGTFTSTDADGDTITATLSGMWQLSGTFLAFGGTLSNVAITDNGAQDGTFNGSNTGSFQISDYANQLFTGAIVQLTANVTGGFFASDFTNAATGVNAQVIPAPAGFVGLLGLAGLAGRRRRR